MKIAAYQFAVTNNIRQNLNTIEKAVIHAAHQDAKLIVFPECALTGYPPRNMENPACISFQILYDAYSTLQCLADKHHMYIVCGTITKDSSGYYNSVVIFSPDCARQFYHKRALWGWDNQNFTAKETSGVFQAEHFNIGVRICFEVRFPEFFRELYQKRTDLNLILFYDVADHDDSDRYELIRSHIRTRAVENVTYTLSVNTTVPCQTAPTALFDRSGRILAELKRGDEQMLLYNLSETEPDFGELGRRQVSDRLLNL